MTVNPSNLSFPEEGGAQTIQVSANYAWTASASGSGFKVSPTSGEGVGTVTVTVNTLRPEVCARLTPWAEGAGEGESGELIRRQLEGVARCAALGMTVNTAVVIMNADTTCIAYAENTTIEENSSTLIMPVAALTTLAPIQ